MKISGFTMVRDADSLYYPIKESLKSLLPVVDELHIALGNSSAGDKTEEIIHSIESNKIKIHHRVWDKSLYHESEILRVETNYALSHCSGDWCFYLQADEVLHENDYPKIKAMVRDAESNPSIDGLLFNYFHFWGDFNHYLPYHGWYNQEIRLFKNNRNIVSVKDAQSFRFLDGNKLNVIESEADVFHYGWVRPPQLMQEKKVVHDGLHHSAEKVSLLYQNQGNLFDYGALGKIPVFKGHHPAIMKSWIKKMDWEESLNYGLSANLNRPLHKHEKWKYRFLTWVENNIFNGKQLGGYKNWNLVSSKK